MAYLAALADKVVADGDFNPKDIGLQGGVAEQVVRLLTTYSLPTV